MDNQEYVGELIDKYGNMILRLSFAYLKNMADAEDVVQEVFLKVIDKKPVFNDENHKKYWLLRTATNICKNKLLAFWNRNKVSIDEIEEKGVYDEPEEGSEVLSAVLSLPEKYRVVIHMYYYEGYSTLEISKILSKTDGAVRSILHRGREKLKEMLKEGYDLE